ncbi:hypothetical protein JQX08_06040 [Pseudomonas sp. UL073]|uniref:HTH luxR-type domain-containing protein n=1 Tax=Zestomonas insulae TaxID=2809017 RepID=A0ABS2IAV4_9GAMM|nr:LuxR C-terminal-related transcriptional regulator [Pseudomonas insulae]MBM7060261.1 hypothetical protein [Pseudomonas insulae]
MPHRCSQMPGFAEVVSMLTPLSEAPFRVAPCEVNAAPAPAPGHVTRAHLLRRLLRSESRLTLTFAPAGFGKSALHGECARLAPAGTRVIWLELLGHTLSPQELLARIAAEVGGDPENECSPDSLGRLLGRVRQPLWLMLDDYPRQPCAELDALVEDLLERTPAHVQWWICGRRRPAWNLPRLILQNAVQELSADDLRFDAAALQSLLCEQPALVAQELRTRLLEQCAGWPALICLLLREATADTLAQRLESGTPLLLNYLQREVRPEQDAGNAELLALQARHPQWFAARPAHRPTYAHRSPPAPRSLLSKRELAILRLIAAGLSNREIADQLCVSTHTIKGHAWNINSKLGTERRTQAVAQAQRQGLLG